MCFCLRVCVLGREGDKFAFLPLRYCLLYRLVYLSTVCVCPCMCVCVFECECLPSMPLMSTTGEQQMGGNKG